MRMSSRAARASVIVLVAGLVILLDQATKSWALNNLSVPRHIAGSVYLTLTFNKGAAFSLGTGVSPILEAGVIILVVALIGFSGRMSRSAPWWAIVALGLLLGGALGNLVDRIFRDVPFHSGAVIDFIQLVTWWPVFNVADASIVVGVALLALYLWMRDVSQRSESSSYLEAGQGGDASGISDE
jgi:signal peptidase II